MFAIKRTGQVVKPAKNVYEYKEWPPPPLLTSQVKRTERTPLGSGTVSTNMLFKSVI